MNKNAYLFAIGVLLIASLVAVAGCGSGNSAEKAKAKELMEEGDKYISEYESTSVNMMDIRGQMQPPADFDPTKEFSDEEIEERMSEVESGMESSKENLEKAKASYQKILSLDDAEDYKEYAEVMLELVGAYEGSMEMIEEVTSRFKGGDSPTDVVTPGMQEMASRISTYGEEIERLESEATEIKEEKNL